MNLPTTKNILGTAYIVALAFSNPTQAQNQNSIQSELEKTVQTTDVNKERKLIKDPFMIPYLFAATSIIIIGAGGACWKKEKTNYKPFDDFDDYEEMPSK